MALLSVEIEPMGFTEGVIGGGGWANADGVTKEALADVFTESFGPFSKVLEFESQGSGPADLQSTGSERVVYAFSTPRKKWYRIEANVISDDEDNCLGNELEIFDADLTGDARGMIDTALGD